VTDGTLQALGVQPMLGRWFTESEHTPAAEGPESIILSHAFCQRRFGGDESALGRTLSLDGNSARIVGIMPVSFRFLDVTPQPDVILAQRISPSQLSLSGFWSRGRLVGPSAMRSSSPA
jgi:hypothetical protein